MKRPVSILAVVSITALAGCGKDTVTAPTPGSTDQWTPTAGPSGGLVVAFGSNGSNLFAATSHDVFRSTDNGATWNATKVASTLCLGVGTIGNTVIAGTEGGSYWSDNDGRTWQPTVGLGSRVSTFATLGT